MVLTSAVFKPPPTSFQYRLWVERGGFPADFDNPICVGCYRLETPPLENVWTLGISNTAGMMIAARKNPVAPKNVIFCPPLPFKLPNLKQHETAPSRNPKIDRHAATFPLGMTPTSIYNNLNRISMRNCFFEPRQSDVCVSSWTMTTPHKKTPSTAASAAKSTHHQHAGDTPTSSRGSHRKKVQQLVGQWGWDMEASWLELIHRNSTRSAMSNLSNLLRWSPDHPEGPITLHHVRGFP